MYQISVSSRRGTCVRFGLPLTDWREGAFWLLLTGLIAFYCPNTYQWFRRYSPAIAIYGRPPAPKGQRLRWKPVGAWAIGLSILFVAAFVALSRPSEFLYFQF